MRQQKLQDPAQQEPKAIQNLKEQSQNTSAPALIPRKG